VGQMIIVHHTNAHCSFNGHLNLNRLRVFDALVEKASDPIKLIGTGPTSAPSHAPAAVRPFVKR